MPIPAPAKSNPSTTASLDKRPGVQVPDLKLRINSMCRRTELRMTITPKPTSVTPDQTDTPVARVGRRDSLALSCRKNRPKRLTANPIPIRPSPVRIQARKVLRSEEHTSELQSL